MNDLVTGEAVVLELRWAKLPTRSLALAIDLLLQSATLIFLMLAGTRPVAMVLDEAMTAAIGLVTVVAVMVGYPVGAETLSRGRSIGKLALGLRVVRDDGGPVRFRHALVRGLFSVLEIWVTVGVVAVVTSLVSSKGKRLGDVFAGTVVVRERVPSSGRRAGGSHGGPVAVMPPALAGWAAGLEMSRLPNDLALAARQYVARATQFAPEVSEGIGRRLATEVAGYLSPPPPAGVPPHAYLSAVLAERRRREMDRLATHQPAMPGTGTPAEPWAGPVTGPWAGPGPAPRNSPPSAPPRHTPPTAAPPQSSPPATVRPESHQSSDFAPPN